MDKLNNFNIEDHVIEQDVSYRGGTLKIDVSELFPYVEDAIVGAYQNYLGGGIAGSIQGGAMFMPSRLKDEDKPVFAELMDRVKRYFYSLNEGGGDEYMHENHTGPDAGGYEALQKMPKQSEYFK